MIIAETAWKIEKPFLRSMVSFGEYDSPFRLYDGRHRRGAIVEIHVAACSALHAVFFKHADGAIPTPGAELEVSGREHTAIASSYRMIEISELSGMRNTKYI
jgi:hypothetical protein